MGEECSDRVTKRFCCSHNQKKNNTSVTGDVLLEHKIKFIVCLILQMWEINKKHREYQSVRALQCLVTCWSGCRPCLAQHRTKLAS